MAFRIVEQKVIRLDLDQDKVQVHEKCRGKGIVPMIVDSEL
jgi:hypothetical protein